MGFPFPDIHGGYQELARRGSVLRLPHWNGKKTLTGGVRHKKAQNQIVKETLSLAEKSPGNELGMTTFRTGKQNYIKKKIEMTMPTDMQVNVDGIRF